MNDLNEIELLRREVDDLRELLAKTIRSRAEAELEVASVRDEAPTTLANWPKLCGCCRSTYSPDNWATLPLVGFVGHFRGVRERYAVELRNCGCGSTIGVDVRLQMAERAAPFTSFHEPGPWRPGNLGGSIVADPDRYTQSSVAEIAAYGGKVIAETVDEKNMRVICGVPAMVAALRACAEAETEEEKKRARDAACQALEAIAPESSL